MIIKALSVKQPWAGLIAEGRKVYEIRTWKVSYRGPLLICVSRQPDRDAIRSLGSDGRLPADLTTGHAICIVDLMDIVPMTQQHVAGAFCDVEANSFAWVLSNVRRIKPFAVPGQLSIYDVKLPAGIK